ncbi:MAG: LamG domain-containing protein [Verrucomicrobiae bacterium]|nr:LamG domain-containing protein [Verrucomicrobiae bacterium]
MKPKENSWLAVLLAIGTALTIPGLPSHAQSSVVLEIFPAFELRFDTEPGSTYQLQSSTNLTTWTNATDAINGDGMAARHLVSTLDNPLQTFRVLIAGGEGLAAHFPLNGSGADSTTNANNGTLMTPVATTNRFGAESSALSFNGGSDRVVVPSSGGLNFSNAFSFSVWVKFESGGNLNPRVFHGGTDFSGYQLYTIGTGSSRQFDFLVNIPGIGWTGPSSSFRSADVWHHIAGTFDGTEVKLFVNGVPDGTAAANGSMAIEDTMLALGRIASQDAGHWLGEIDELRLYSRVLSAEEIAVLFQLQQ